MGCMCSKSAAVEDSRENQQGGRLKRKGSLEKHVQRANSSGREAILRSKDKYGGSGGGDVKVLPIHNKSGGSNRFQYNDQVEEKRVIDKFEVVEKNKGEKCGFTIVSHHPSSERVLNSIEGEQVAAGWPAWLVAVAGEAIKGWIPRRANSFEKLDKIGQGTYSSVYKARDRILDKLVALKRVKCDNRDPESVKFMAREIILLRRLDHPNVIKLEGLIVSPTSCSLYLVFEYMEHDLVGLASLPGIKFTEPQIKCYMQQLLSGLDHCHSHGVLHRDIKGSNLLIDSNGILKIADFGLAIHFDPRDSVPMTSRVVTLWYRPPELLLGATHYGVAVDLWSAGCILGELYSGKPILPGKTEVEQLHKIFKLCGSPTDEYWRRAKLPHSTVFKPLHPYKRCIAETFKEFPSPAVTLMETLLSIDPVHRKTAAFSLKSELFTTQPLACDPSSLPKYPSSLPKYPPEHNRNKISHSGPLVKGTGFRNFVKEHDDHHVVSSKTNLSKLSGFVAARTSASEDHRQKQGPLTLEAVNQAGRPRRSFNEFESSGNLNVRQHMPKTTESPLPVGEKACSKDSSPVTHGGGSSPMGSKMYLSGPLLAPSNNMDQMLKDHDRKIQEFARRRARHGKKKLW